MNRPCGQQGGGLAPDRGGRAAGFTLVEMVITLVIVAVLFALAVPSFRSMVISNRLTTAANEVIDAINIARVEAIKRNGNVQLCSSTASLNTTDTLGTKCATSAGAVYGASVGSDGAAVLDQIRGPFIGIASPLKISGDFNALRFNGQGMGMKAGSSGPYNGAVIDICTSSLSANNHRKVTLVAGSIAQIEVSSETCT